MDNPYLAAALEYAARGWCVLPLHVRGKRPRPTDWVNVATTDAAVIRGWWRDVPTGNVGVALGSRSGLVSIDIDTEEGSRLVVELSGGDLPPTVEMVTGKGGRPLFAIPDGLDFEPRTWSESVAGPPDPATGRPTKVEILRCQGLGGQCVMPPSIHPGGKTYAWVDGLSPADLDPAPMPGWLIESMRPEPDPAADVAHPAAPNWSDAVPANEPRDESFNHAADWWAHVLQPAGFTPSRPARGDRGSYRYCRPGKSDKSVAVTVGYYKARDGTDALHCFSSSVYGLDPGKTYDKFGAFARLFFNGDFAAAARAAVGKGIIKARAVRRPGARQGGARPAGVEPAAAPEPDDPDAIPAAWADGAYPDIGALTAAEAVRWLRRLERVS